LIELLKVAGRSSTISVVVVVVSAVVINTTTTRMRRSKGRAEHWFGNGERPIGSWEEIWLSVAVMIDEKWRRKCAQTHECVLVMHMVTVVVVEGVLVNLIECGGGGVCMSWKKRDGIG
jgi:hypothetical protein